jgi:hypothetical protein
MLEKVLLAVAATLLIAGGTVAIDPAPASAHGFACLKAAKAAHPGKLKPKLACLFKGSKA